MAGPTSTSIACTAGSSCPRPTSAPTPPSGDASRFPCCGTRTAGASSTTNRATSCVCSARRSRSARSATPAELALYPPELREEIDALNERIYETVNNGVYRAGFARRQESYEEAFAELFASLDWLETLLGERRYLAGDRATEADWRLFATLARFDEVYNLHFRCNRRRLVDYPNLWAYARELFQWPGVAATVAMEQIKRHYYTTHDELNPKKIIPVGPGYDWSARPRPRSLKRSLHSPSSRLALRWNRPPGSDELESRAPGQPQIVEIPRGPNSEEPRMTPSTTAETQLVIPDELKPADGRFGCGPSKVRPEALAALASDGASVMGTSHRQKPVKALVGEIRAGLRELFSLPDGYEVALGNGGATCFWDAAAFGLIGERSAHLAFGEFSQKFATVSAGAPFLGEPAVVTAEPGDAPEPAAAGKAAAESGADVVAWAHNETSTGVMAAVERPAERRRGTRADRRHIRRRRAGGRRLTDRRLLLRAAEELRRRRRAVAGAAQPRRAAAHRRARRLRPLDPRLPVAAHGAGELAQRPDVQHAGRGLAVSAGRADPLDARLAAGWTGAWRAAASPRGCCTAGRSAAATRRRSFQTPPSARSVVGTIDFADEVDAAAIAKTLRANGIVDTEPYRKLGRNQLRIGMFPAVEPADVQALTACIDWVVERTSA